MNKKSVQKVIISIGYVLWVAFSFFLGSLVVSLPAYASKEIYRFMLTPAGSMAVTAIGDGLAVLIAFSPMLVKKISWKNIFEKVGLDKLFRPKMIGWALLAWLVYMVASSVVTAVLLAINVPGLNPEQRQSLSGFENLQGFFQYAAAFIALVGVAPFFEELLFRGYLFGRIRATSGVWLAAILTSAIFATGHLQFGSGSPLLWTAAIDTFVLSLALCYLRNKFDSIWPGVMVHALKNGLAYTVLFILPLCGVKLI